MLFAYNGHCTTKRLKILIMRYLPIKARITKRQNSID